MEALKQHTPRSILLIRLDGIGDVVISLATIKAFHELYPQAILSVLVYGHSKPLVEHLPGVKQVLVFDKRHWGSVVQLVVQLWRERRDWSVHLTHTNCWTPGFLAVLGGKIKISFDKPNGEAFFDVMVQAPDVHTFKKQEALARAFGYGRPFNIPAIPLTGVDKQIINVLLRRGYLDGRRRFLVGLYLGNGRQEVGKRWSLTKHVALAERLMEAFSCQIVALWGPDERNLLPPFDDAVKHLVPRPWVHPPTTLTEMAALLACLDVVVAPTTGPMHVAEAMGTSLVALCRYSVYFGWRPLGERHRALQAPGDDLEAIEVDAVFVKVKELLEGTEPNVNQRGPFESSIDRRLE
jgi:ADP-heptose:LPS heptosyltransferase